MQGDVSGHAGRFDGRHGRALPVRIDPADRGDHILAGSQDPHDDLVVGQQWRIHDAVGIGCQQLVNIVGGEHPDRGLTCQFAHVTTVLVGAVHPAADEIEFGVAQNGLDRCFSDTAGGPLDHCVHRNPSSFIATPRPVLAPYAPASDLTRDLAQTWFWGILGGLP